VHQGRVYPPRDSGYDPEEVVDAATGAAVATLDYEVLPAFGGGLGLFYEDGALVARDATTYAQRWTFTPSRVSFGPLVAGQDVYVADGERIHVLDLQTGATRWSGSVGENSTFLGMAIAQGTLVVGTGRGLVAFRATGAPAQPGLAQVEPAPVDLGPLAPAPGATTNTNVDAAHSGGLNVSDPAPPLKRRWRVKIQAHAPLVADGRVFAIKPGAQRLDPLTGTPIWTYGGGATAAAYDRGRLFVTNASEGLVALDAETGAKLWTVPLAGERVPVAAEGELYIGYGSTVTRYDPASGAVLWTHTDEGYVSSRRTVALDGPYVYAACSVLSRATGQPAKPLAVCTGSEYRFAPVNAGHMIEWGNNRIDLLDIDVERGGVIVGRLGSTAAPAVLGNLAVRTTRGVYAYEFPSWRPRWSYPDPEGDRTAIAPLILGRHVYVATVGGTLRAFDANTGAVVWRDTTIGTFMYPYPEPDAIQMAAGERLLLVPGSHELTAYESVG
jgi:outer membrane protein assembly factor BamB